MNNLSIKSSRILTAIIAALVIISATTSTVSVISWVDKPITGFVLYKPFYIGSMSLPDWLGIRTDLKYLDCMNELSGVLKGHFPFNSFFPGRRYSPVWLRTIATVPSVATMSLWASYNIVWPKGGWE